MSKCKLVKSEPGFMVVWTEFQSRRKEEFTTADVCFDVSLSLYIKALMCLKGTGLGFGGVSGSSPSCRPKN